MDTKAAAFVGVGIDWIWMVYCLMEQGNETNNLWIVESVPCIMSIVMKVV